MIAVVNASPLIQLEKIGRLHLLNDFFTTVYIPNAVMHEIQSLNLTRLTYTVLPFIYPNAVSGILHPLHMGEAEVIIGAKELSADIAVLDDREARNRAKKFNIHVVGTLGILQRANKQGMIIDFAQTIMFLRDSGMYISESLMEKLIK